MARRKRRLLLLALTAAGSSALHAGSAFAGATLSTVRHQQFVGLDISSTRHPFHVRCDAINWDVVTISVEGMTLDADRFVCEGRDSPLLGDAVYLIGGPYQSLRPFPDPYVLSAIVAGYDVYVPRYSGTFDNSLAVRGSLNWENTAGGGELEVAAHEVGVFSRFVEDENSEKRRRTVLLAESAAGYIAALSCQDFCFQSIALFSPLVQSPIQFWENFAKSATMTGEEWFTYNGSETPERRLEAAQLASIGFYGQRNWSLDLCGAFARAPAQRDVRVFYGDRDPRIGVEQMPKLAAGCGAVRFDVSSYPDDKHRVLQTSAHGEFGLICWLRSQAGVADSQCEDDLPADQR